MRHGSDSTSKHHGGWQLLLTIRYSQQPPGKGAGSGQWALFLLRSGRATRTLGVLLVNSGPWGLFTPHIAGST